MKGAIMHSLAKKNEKPKLSPEISSMLLKDFLLQSNSPFDRKTCELDRKISLRSTSNIDYYVSYGKQLIHDLLNKVGIGKGEKESKFVPLPKELLEKTLKERSEHLKEKYSGVPSPEKQDYIDFFHSFGLDDSFNERFEVYLDTLSQKDQTGDTHGCSQDSGIILGLDESDTELLLKRQNHDEFNYKNIRSYPSESLFSSFIELENKLGKGNIEVSDTIPSEGGWIVLTSSSEESASPLRNIGFYLGEDANDGLHWVLRKGKGNTIVIYPLEFQFTQLPESTYNPNPSYKFIKIRKHKLPFVCPIFPGELSKKIQKWQKEGKEVNKNNFLSIGVVLLSNPGEEEAMAGMLDKFLRLNESSDENKERSGIRNNLTMDIDVTENLVEVGIQKEGLLLRGKEKSAIEMITAALPHLIIDIEVIRKDLKKSQKDFTIDRYYASWTLDLLNRLEKDCRIQEIVNTNNISINKKMINNFRAYSFIFSRLGNRIKGNCADLFPFIESFGELNTSLAMIEHKLDKLEKEAKELNEEAGRKYYIEINGIKAEIGTFTKFLDRENREYKNIFEHIGKIRKWVQENEQKGFLGIHDIKRVLDELNIDIKDLSEKIYNFVENNRDTLKEKDLEIVENTMRNIYGTIFVIGSGELREGIKVEEGYTNWENLY